MTFQQISNLKSNIGTTVFPAIPSAYPSMLLSAFHQLGKSQWWTPEQIRGKQFQQLNHVLLHAYNNIPFYRRRLKEAGIKPAKGITAKKWSTLPFLVRRDFQGKEDEFLAKSIPDGHGELSEIKTSGSTAEPIRVYATGLVHFFWSAFTLRDHDWHKRDFNGKLASIRHIKGNKAQYPGGMDMKTWGDPVQTLYHTGPASALDIKRTDVIDQLEWLSRQKPEYLLTYPSNALELAKLTISKGLTFPSLKELRLMGEVADKKTLNICKQAWNIPVADAYSANEVGYIALQCQEQGNYHIQSENLYVEIIDDKGKPCAPGETGKVVVTTLHNFAMPLIRYQIGDYAEVGEPCSCGRGLPVLARILGRVRNMLVLPTGEKYWPSSGSLALPNIAPIKQQQTIQKDSEHIEVRLVVGRPLTREEEEQARKVVISKLGYDFKISFVYLDKIERSAGGKFEEFMSELPQMSTSR
ncbi:MAG: phenylacetate--CoA ligase family protein [Gammaproteobacteria bacterium]|nr:phenylacetate--CoA ligase family protein [Gammaproteobacteria bacterium]NNJ84748.1 phenylacetate--CoA ligase family protein [Gammaproteobacteria bacterium]